MRIEIKGNIDVDCLQETVEEVVGNWLSKLEKENPEMRDQLNNIQDVKAPELTINLQFLPEGSEEWQVLSTDNHKGIPELLTVTAEVGEDGELIWDSVEDNDENSNFSELEALIAKGITEEEPAIETSYPSIDEGEALESAEIVLNESTVIEVHKTEEETVVRVYKLLDTADIGYKLVTEVAFHPDQFDALVDHYTELAEL